MAADLSARFAARFGRPPEAVASAPGRVNLIGEHTDYNDGFVLPLAIPQRTTAAVARRSDRTVHAASEQAAEAVRFALGEEARRSVWADYVAGVTAVLGRDGHALAGFDLLVDSDVPLGAGLSSSAALEVAVARALRELLGLQLDDVALALAGQQAEGEVVGARTGVMDQLAASLGAPDRPLLIDCRSLDVRPVALPAGVEPAVVDSGVRHALATGGYNDRREECERAAALLGVRALRDVAPDDPRLDGLPAPLDRRARHVVEENARVLGFVAALEAGDLAAAGRLLDASHASQRDLFAVSVPEVDRIAAAARAEGALGARLTGGGFGGSVVALAPAGEGRALAERVARRAGGTAVLPPPLSAP